VLGVVAPDPAVWRPAFASHFDGLAPSLVDLVVPRRDKAVLALLFETDRAPFVGKNPQFGSAGVVIEREVPWREGTAVRSALDVHKESIANRGG
jgi:hypothetical protein